MHTHTYILFSLSMRTGIIFNDRALFIYKIVNYIYYFIIQWLLVKFNLLCNRSEGLPSKDLCIRNY